MVSTTRSLSVVNGYFIFIIADFTLAKTSLSWLKQAQSWPKRGNYCVTCLGRGCEGGDGWRFARRFTTILLAIDLLLCYGSSGTVYLDKLAGGFQRMGAKEVFAPANYG